MVTGTVIFITLIAGGITGIGRIVTTVFAPVVSSVIAALIIILQRHIVVHLALVKSVLGKTVALLFPDFALGCANPTLRRSWWREDILVSRPTSPQQRSYKRHRKPKMALHYYYSVICLKDLMGGLVSNIGCSRHIVLTLARYL